MGACLAIACFVGCGGSPEAETAEAPPVRPLEVDLGSFRFTAYDPTANSQTRFDFKIAAKVESPLPEAVTRELANKENRIRDRILVISRESTVEELEDPALEVFRRRLIKELNRVLEEGEIQDLYLNHYRVKTR